MTDILNDIIEALSLYSSESLVPHILAETPDYRLQAKAAENKFTALQELLPPEGQKLLKEFSDARDSNIFIEINANFRAGLVIGMTLSLLNHHSVLGMK